MSEEEGAVKDNSTSKMPSMLRKKIKKRDREIRNKKKNRIPRWSRKTEQIQAYYLTDKRKRQVKNAEVIAKLKWHDMSYMYMTYIIYFLNNNNYQLR